MEIHNVLSQERRRVRRVEVQIPLICELPDKSTGNLVKKTCLIRNVSLQGLYFETEGDLPELRSEIKGSFELPNIDKILNFNLKIKRLETTSEENKSGVGAAFVNLSDADKDEIEKVLFKSFDIRGLFELAIKKGASDLHLLAEHQPVMRLQGNIETLDIPKLSKDDIPAMLYPIMSKEQIRKFEEDKELDFAIQFDLQNRFRINLHRQRGYLEATMRLINTRISSFEELNIPEAAKGLARQKNGLVLIVGPTGSGKTTTIAAIVELINQEKQGVIITLERPIEYVYINAKSIVKQREVGLDTNSFSAALKSTLRQDPNVIVVGELDDIETVRTALIAAEAGYLVIASFHAPNTSQAIDRLANMFPIEHRKAILFQLSNCIKGIICQLLLPSRNQVTRVLASEVVLVNEAIRRHLRNDELIQIPTTIQVGKNQGMRSMHDSIWWYYENGIIDGIVAEAYDEEFKKANHLK